MKCIAFQAQEDLKAADNDYHSANPAYEWVCFKAHQAAEKALKAAQFSVDAVASFNHDLPSLAATIEDQELRSLAIKLQVRNYDLFTHVIHLCDCHFANTREYISYGCVPPAC